MEKNIHELLHQFQELWDESLNGDYSHDWKLRKVAKQIQEIKDNDCNISVSNTEFIALQHALIIANIK